MSYFHFQQNPTHMNFSRRLAVQERNKQSSREYIPTPTPAAFLDDVIH
jgi:hypothetical protein